MPGRDDMPSFVSHSIPESHVAQERRMRMRQTSFGPDINSPSSIPGPVGHLRPGLKSAAMAVSCRTLTVPEERNGATISKAERPSSGLELVETWLLNSQTTSAAFGSFSSKLFLSFFCPKF